MSETVSFKGFLKGDPDTVEEEVRRFNIDKEVGYDMTIFKNYVQRKLLIEYVFL